LAYAAFGNYAQQHQWLPLALGVSIAVPVLVAAAAQRWLPGRRPDLKTQKATATAAECQSGEHSAPTAAASSASGATDQATSSN